MKNRIPTYPGRVVLTPVQGAANTYDMVRADVPLEEGTPLNKETLLQDSTATMLGLGSDATPDDAIKSLATKTLDSVPKTRKINSKTLENDITLSAQDVGTLPITYGTNDLTAGSSPLATGTIYIVYE